VWPAPAASTASTAGPTHGAQHQAAPTPAQLEHAEHSDHAEEAQQPEQPEPPSQPSQPQLQLQQVQQPDVAVMLLLDVGQCRAIGPPNSAFALSVARAREDPRFEKAGGSQGHLLPAAAPNGYWCEMGGAVGDGLIKLPLRGNKQLFSAVGLKRVAGRPGVVTSTLSSPGTPRDTAAKEREGMFKESSGLATWPAIFKYPSSFDEAPHMPNLVSMVLDNTFDVEQAPCFDVERDAAYVVFKVDCAVYLCVVFKQDAFPAHNEGRKEIITFCNSLKRSLAVDPTAR
jgi:hypothetical protein